MDVDVMNVVENVFKFIDTGVNEEIIKQRNSLQREKMPKRKNFLNKIEQRKKSALARQVLRDKRTPEEQLAELDKLFGKDKGAVKERTRLTNIVTISALKDKFSSTPNKRDKNDRKGRRKDTK